MEQLTKTVVIGCSDVGGCGVAALEGIQGRSELRPLGLESASVCTPAVAHENNDLLKLSLFQAPDAVRDTTFMSLNLTHEDAVSVAHELVSAMRDSGKVADVLVTGGIRIPAAPLGTMYKHCINGARDLEGAEDLPELPGETVWNDELLAALHYWLLASGLSATFVLVATQKASEQTRHGYRVDASGARTLQQFMCKALGTAVSEAGLGEMHVVCGHQWLAEASRSLLMYA